MAEPDVLETAASPVEAFPAAGPAPPAGGESGIVVSVHIAIDAVVAAGSVPAPKKAATVGKGDEAAAAVAAVAAVVESEPEVIQRFANEAKARKADMLIVIRQAAKTAAARMRQAERKAAARASVAEERRRGLAGYARVVGRAAATVFSQGGTLPNRSGTADQEMDLSRRGRRCWEGLSSLARTVRRAIREGSCLLILLAVCFLLALGFVCLVEGSNAKTCSRGYVLSPGDSPLLPGECLEGTGGVRRLGFLPGLSWKPKLSVGAGGETILSRPDGSEILLAGAVPVEKSRVSVLCRAERLVRGAAKVGTPVYGARSRLGRLLVGKERFCSVDASVKPSSMSRFKVWRRGDGILSFSEDGRLQMMTASGDVVWSDAEGRSSNEIEEWRILGKIAAKARDEEDRSKRLKKLERDLDLTARRKESAKHKEGGEDEKTEPKKKKKGRKRLFGSNAGGAAASEAEAEPASAATQETPHAQNVVFRMLGWGRSSPKGAGGQSD